MPPALVDQVAHACAARACKAEPAKVETARVGDDEGACIDEQRLWHLETKALGEILLLPAVYGFQAVARAGAPATNGASVHVPEGALGLALMD